MNWPRSARKPDLETQLDAELRFHIDRLIEEKIASGMTPREARRQAALEFGGSEQVKEELRKVHGLHIFQDVRFAFRMFRRSPGFSILAVLCLALGIGATTSVFGWIEGILLRPFPAVAHQERLVAVTGTDRQGRTDVSWPDFMDLQRYCTLIDAVIVDRIFGTTLSIGDRAERASASIVSANYFDAIGVRPLLGRGFLPGEDIGSNAHPVAVISYVAWKDRYGGDPAIIGRTQMLNGVKHTIVGVMPQGFLGTFVGYSFQFWVPASMEELFERGGYKLENRGARWIEGYARLKPGVTIEQAQAEVSAVAHRLEHDYPETNRSRGIRLYPLWQTPFNGAGTMLPTLRITLVVACFVLLIACANVANLLLVRSFARRHEMTVRLAIGAGAARLLKQLLAEGLILSLFAATGGLLLAYWCRNLMVLFFPPSPGIIANFPSEIDWRVLAVSAGICAVTTLLVGLIPALQARKLDLAGAIKCEAGGVVGGHGKSWLRSGLVLVQVALSFILLVSAGLLLRSMSRMQNADPGFSIEGVLTSSVDLIAAGYTTPRTLIFQNELLERIRLLPGIQSAVFARNTPFSYRGYAEAPIAVDGYDTLPGEPPTLEYNQVGPGYLAAVGIPLVSGREFTRADDETALPVAVVNETMAAQFWRGRDPVGGRLQVDRHWLQVVGVAKNSTYHTLIDPPQPFFYIPMRQGSPGLVLHIRTPLGPEAIAQALAREVHAIDPNLAPGETITMREMIDRMSWAQRAAVMLVGIFGGVALLLAGIGLYGVMSYAVSQRARELGLRMALGAGASDLLRLVMTHGATLTLFGIVGGAATAVAATRLMGNLLYQVSPRDPLAFASAFAVMALASAAACFFPAWRATRTDPVRALRE